MTWVTVRKHAERTGYSEDAIRSKMADGTWLEGVVWKKAPDGRVLISEEGYDAWVEARVSVPTASRRSRSTSGTAASAAVRD